MKITVEHEVPFDSYCPNQCVGSGDFEGREICQYYKLRDRTHGRKAPVERKKPKCALFDEWLDAPYKRCDKCLRAVHNAEVMN